MVLNKNHFLDEAVYQYYSKVGYRESIVLQQLHEETAKLPQANNQVSPEQGQWLHLLVKLTNAKRIIEVGTFAGYSSICMATALPQDGQLIACDICKEWTEIAKKYWQHAHIAHKITLRLAPASETLVQLLDDKRSGDFDFIFVDANKNDYDTYYEYGLQLIKTGGIIVFDNMLAAGKMIVSNHKDDSKIAQTLRALNNKIHQDERVDMCMLPIGTGMTIVIKR